MKREPLRIEPNPFLREVFAKQREVLPNPPKPEQDLHRNTNATGAETAPEQVMHRNINATGAASAPESNVHQIAAETVLEVFRLVGGQFALLGMWTLLNALLPTGSGIVSGRSIFSMGEMNRRTVYRYLHDLDRCGIIELYDKPREGFLVHILYQSISRTGAIYAPEQNLPQDDVDDFKSLKILKKSTSSYGTESAPVQNLHHYTFDAEALAAIYLGCLAGKGDPEKFSSQVLDVFKGLSLEKTVALVVECSRGIQVNPVAYLATTLARGWEPQIGSLGKAKRLIELGKVVLGEYCEDIWRDIFKSISWDVPQRLRASAALELKGKIDSFVRSLSDQDSLAR